VGDGADADGAGPERSRGARADPAPVASLDELEHGAADEEASGPVAQFDGRQIEAARADVPVADLGQAATRRASRRMWAVEADASGRRGATSSGGASGRGSRLGDAGGRDRARPEPDSASEVDVDTAARRTRRHRDRLTPEMAASAAAAASAIHEQVEQRHAATSTAPRPLAHNGGTGVPGHRSGADRELDREPDPDADPMAVARTICLRLLTERARTRHELDLALRRKGVPAEAARTVLERFGEVGLIDDAAFAEQWVHTRHTGRGLGRRALAVELRRKGVADDVAGDALGELDVEAEQQRARQLVDRKLRRQPLGSPEQRSAAARRLAGMLARKGYGSGVAYRVVREAITAYGAEPDEFGPDEGMGD
jgi:regulatory protein